MLNRNPYDENGQTICKDGQEDLPLNKVSFGFT